MYTIYVSSGWGCCCYMIDIKILFFPKKEKENILSSEIGDWYKWFVLRKLMRSMRRVSCNSCYVVTELVLNWCSATATATAAMNGCMVGDGEMLDLGGDGLEARLWRRWLLEVRGTGGNRTHGGNSGVMGFEVGGIREGNRVGYENQRIIGASC